MADNFAIATAVTGIAAFASGVQILRKTLHATSLADWATTKGTILNAEIRTEYNRRMGQHTYVPFVEYEYRVRGRTYRGTTVSPVGLQSCSIQSVCQRIVGKYPAGETVPVYYDPDDPEESCLDRTVTGTNVALMLVCAALCFLAAILLPLFGFQILTI